MNLCRYQHINRFAIAAAVLFVLLLSCLVLFAYDNMSNPLPDSPKQKYRLIFREDFNGDTLDLKHWRKIPRNVKVAWSACLSDHSSLYDISDGRLRLYARENTGVNSGDTAKYLLGGVETKNMVGFTYGKVEVRARMTGAQGVVSAIWLVATKPKPYPDYMELDILEHINERMTADQTVHNNYIDKLGFKDKPLYQVKPQVNYLKYNTYAVEVLPDRVIFSINGRKTLVYPRIETQHAGQFPFGSGELFLRLNMEAGYNKWLRDVDLSKFPVYMDIDWVKFYDVAL